MCLSGVFVYLSSFLSLWLLKRDRFGKKSGNYAVETFPIFSSNNSLAENLNER